MITEVVLDGIGICRVPNMWQDHSLKKIKGENMWLARYAATLSMTIKQFKSLPIEQQELIRRAYLLLISPSNMGPGESRVEMREDGKVRTVNLPSAAAAQSPVAQEGCSTGW